MAHYPVPPPLIAAALERIVLGVMRAIGDPMVLHCNGVRAYLPPGTDRDEWFRRSAELDRRTWA